MGVLEACVGAADGARETRVGDFDADVGALLTDVGALETCVGALDGATVLTSVGAELFGFVAVALETVVGALELMVAFDFTDPTLEILLGLLP